MKLSEIRQIIKEEIQKAIKESYYNPGWKLSAVQDWIETYAMNNRLNFKLIHKTNKNSTIGPHAKTNTYYVYDIGDKHGIVVRNEKVPGAPRLDQLYVIVGPKGLTLGSLVGASTLTDGSEQDLIKLLDKVIAPIQEGAFEDAMANLNNKVVTNPTGAKNTMKPQGTVIWSALEMAKIFKLMKSKGYNPKVNEGSMLNIKTIEIGVPNGGMMKIARDGNLYGDYNWGASVKTVDELLDVIKQFPEDQKEYN